MKRYLLTFVSFLSLVNLSAQEDPKNYKSNEIMVMVNHNESIQDLVHEHQFLNLVNTDLKVKIGRAHV